VSYLSFSYFVKQYKQTEGMGMDTQSMSDVDVGRALEQIRFTDKQKDGEGRFVDEMERRARRLVTEFITAFHGRRFEDMKSVARKCERWATLLYEYRVVLGSEKDTLTDYLCGGGPVKSSEGWDG
jgi:hypothetical protein